MMTPSIDAVIVRVNTQNDPMCLHGCPVSIETVKALLVTYSRLAWRLQDSAPN
jgi:hypothetical protein